MHDKPKEQSQNAQDTKKQAFLLFKNITIKELSSLKEFSFYEQNSPLEHNLVQEALVISNDTLYTTTYSSKYQYYTTITKHAFFVRVTG